MRLVIFLPEAETHHLSESFHSVIIKNDKLLVGRGIQIQSVTILKKKCFRPLCHLNRRGRDFIIQPIRNNLRAEHQTDPETGEGMSR